MNDTIHPERWLQNPGWRNGHIHPIPREWAWLLGFGLIFTAIPLWLFFNELHATHPRLRDLLFLLLFVAIGLVTAYFGIARRRRQQQGRQLCLTLDPYPGRIGAEFGGQLLIPGRTPGQVADSKLLLTCLRVAKDTDDSDEVIWQQQLRSRIERTASGSRVRFLTRIDAGLPDAEPEKSLAWHLTWTSSLAQVGYTFDVPVFDIGPPVASRQALDPGPQALSEEQFPGDIVTIHRTPDRLVLSYPAGRNPAGPWLTAFGAVFLLSGGAVVAKGGILIGCIASLMGCAAVVAGIYTWLLALEVVVDRDELVVKRTIGEWRTRSSIPIKDLARITKTNPGWHGSGPDAAYLLKAIGPASSLAIGIDVRGQAFADGLMTLVCEQINLARPAAPLVPETEPGHYRGSRDTPPTPKAIKVAIKLVVLLVAFIVIVAISGFLVAIF